MKTGLIISFLILFSQFNTFAAIKSGGDDAGNGGFAFLQSKRLLELAATELLPVIKKSEYPLFQERPEIRTLLMEVLNYNKLEQHPEKEGFRNGQLLMFDYANNPNRVIIYNAYYLAFAGTADSEIYTKVVEVKKRLLHEASHLWGLNETEAEKFSISLLSFAGEPPAENSRHDITIKPDFCVCNMGRSESTSRCDYFCGKYDTNHRDDVPILYFTGQLTREDQQNPKIGNLYNWCTEVLNEHERAPNCKLQIYDGVQNDYKDINLFENASFANAKINSLGYGHSYIVKIVSSTGAISSAIEVKRKRESDKPIIPLTMTNISQYFCVDKIAPSTEQNFNNYHSHYFYNNYNYPNPSPLGYQEVFCHNKNQLGESDNPLYPRLGLDDQAFYLYDPNDPLLYDLDFNRKLDIEDLINQLYIDEYGTYMPNPELFSSMTTYIEPGFGPSNSDKGLGYVLKPFLINGKKICPTTIELNSGNRILHILKNFISNTEALYKAERERVVARHPTGDIYELHGDRIYINETKLKKIWFHYENNQYVIPTDESARQKRVMFYWPPNYTQPFVKSVSQSLYTLTGLNDKGITDGRVGCIPKSN